MRAVSPGVPPSTRLYRRVAVFPCCTAPPPRVGRHRWPDPLLVWEHTSPGGFQMPAPKPLRRGQPAHAAGASPHPAMQVPSSNPNVLLAGDTRPVPAETLPAVRGRRPQLLAHDAAAVAHAN